MSYLEPINDNGKSPRRQPKPIKKKTVREPVEPKEGATNTLAVIALVLGIVAFISGGIAGIGGIIVGGLALIRIRSGEALGRTMALVGVILSVVAILASVAGGIAVKNAVDTAAKNTKATSTVSVAQVRKTIAADVKATTANVKAYLAKNPDATIDEMLNNSKIVNSRLAEGETVNIANMTGNAKTGYKSWQVVGADTKVLGTSLNYNYQSYSNTYRWFNNKTGASSEITVDKAARNRGADH